MANTIETIAKERENPAFTIEEMTYLLDGGEEETQLKQLVHTRIYDDENLRVDNLDMSRPEERRATLKKVAHVISIWAETRSKDQSARNQTVSTSNQTKTQSIGQKLARLFWKCLAQYDPSWATRIGVHFGLFNGAIESQGHGEMIEKYSEDIINWRIIGCFAMTELGHGSYIRGFETTSTYDVKTQEFIINSPTITSTKWWIGLAGQTATHTVVFARLIIDEEDYGVHSFLCQIRSCETGEPMPGIEVGDCGAKMGRNGLDNGFIRFNNVRIPREQMLMRYSQVSPSGEYSKPPKAQLSYGALVQGRVTIVVDCVEVAKKALTIAVRYSACRRQFPAPGKGKTEQQIIDYQTHQFRLMPLLATTFAMHFSTQNLVRTNEQLLENLRNNDLRGLAQVHATSAGLKAFCTWWTNSTIEQCRQCLGGHGYSKYSGLSTLLADFAVNCTWEGDNTVMAQQTARFLVSAYDNVKGGRFDKLGEFEKYLIDADTLLGYKCSSRLLDHEIQLEALRYVAVKLVKTSSEKLIALQDKGMSKEQAWNETMQELVFASEAHCDYFMLHSFVEGIAAAEAEEQYSSLSEILTLLCNLFAFIKMEKNLKHTLAGGYFSAKHAEEIQNGILELCKEVRKHAVNIVDAFNVPDFVLNSPLGAKDGNIYEKYFARVKAAPHCQGVPEYWEDLIKPLTAKL